jgi:hypothetical protein
MVRRGAAAARDPNAPPAHEMEVHGLENPPRLLAQLASGISAFARNINYLWIISTPYRNEYLTRYTVKPGMEFFYDAVEYQAGWKPDDRFPSSVC